MYWREERCMGRKFCGQNHAAAPWPTIAPPRTHIRFLFSRLQQGSRPSRAGEQLRKAEGGSRENNRIDREPREHQIGAQNMVEQHAAQALEKIGRRQGPAACRCRFCTIISKSRWRAFSATASASEPAPSRSLLAITYFKSGLAARGRETTKARSRPR